METNLAAFVLIGFAGWRVAYLLVFEDGPFGVFAGLRRAVGVPDEAEVTGLLPSLFSCVHCMSFWTVAGFTGLFWIEPRAVVPFAAWGLALAIHHAVRA